jgi:hypothetical protein
MRPAVLGMLLDRIYSPDLPTRAAVLDSLGLFLRVDRTLLPPDAVDSLICSMDAEDPGSILSDLLTIIYLGLRGAVLSSDAVAAALTRLSFDWDTDLLALLGDVLSELLEAWPELCTIARPAAVTVCLSPPRIWAAVSPAARAALLAVVSSASEPWISEFLHFNESKLVLLQERISLL